MHVSLAVLVVLAAAGSGSAAFYDFTSITNNRAGDVSIGTTQLSLEVTSPAADQVLFTFGNTGPGASVIEQVFFESGVLGGVVSLANSAGVLFAQDLPNAGNLPGGNSLSPKFDEAFSFAAASPAPFQGVNNTLGGTETVGVLFGLADGKTFGDVLAGLADKSFRVGLHVIAFDSGGSESFVSNEQTAEVPLPGAGLLLLAGMGAAMIRRRGT